MESEIYRYKYILKTSDIKKWAKKNEIEVLRKIILRPKIFINAKFDSPNLTGLIQLYLLNYDLDEFFYRRVTLTSKYFRSHLLGLLFYIDAHISFDPNFRWAVDTIKLDISKKNSVTKIDRNMIRDNDTWMEKNIHPQNFKGYIHNYYCVDVPGVCAA
jgi:hypothetical protein